ncbi:hypothetical protein ACJ41O_004540 [Fusarium nematophilum]
MAAASPNSTSTPKRKRGEELWLSPVHFSFQLDPSSSAANPEDGSNSPRSRVAHKFRGLALESGGGAVSSDDSDALECASNHPGCRRPGWKEVKKRTGSPPLRMKRPPRRPFDDGDGDQDGMEIVDPVRAALTWHEDEITIYDPEDEDDDGTGINGIGFKPTPALAQARAMKRRQQMAEYRKREESEARARRSQRRGRGSGITIGPREKSPSRKVRFMDADAQTFAITTG